MRTEKQIEASRAEAGNAISSQNALRHGILASSVVLEGESEETFMDMMEKLFAELEPLTETEIALVEELGIARWRQMRVWSAEKANLDKHMQLQRTGSGPDRLSNVIESNGTPLSNILRYDIAFSRMQRSVLRQLKIAKADRPADLDLTPRRNTTKAIKTWKPGPYPVAKDGKED